MKREGLERIQRMNTNTDTWIPKEDRMPGRATARPLEFGHFRTVEG
jgi:hypothetical protein